jgi:hypothetical protein
MMDGNEQDQEVQEQDTGFNDMLMEFVFKKHIMSDREIEERYDELNDLNNGY